jgi:RNA polymerase sigma-54 factor
MLKQQLSQKLLQKLSPQQIQLMKLLQLPTVALEQRIKEEMEANPVLEEGKELESEDNLDITQDEYEADNEVSEAEKEFDYEDYIDDDDTPDYKLYVNNKGKDEEEKSIPLSGGITFHQKLEEQLSLLDLDDETFTIAHYLIGSLDDAGYLRRDLKSIVDDLAFTQNIITTPEKVEEALKIIQSFDPPGVGARDLRECLLLQLKRKHTNTPAHKLAIAIIEDSFEEFSKKHYDKIIKKLNITEEELKAAIDEILKLNPKPGNSANDASPAAQAITPDFIVTINNGKLELSLNGRNVPELRVSRQYADMLRDYSKNKNKTKADKEAITFVKQKLDSAKWFIDAIKQREHTLMSVMQAILDYQKDYFLEGDETLLKPMILKDIADKVGLDISTVSRVVNSKYVQTPYGTFLLKSFFSESLSTDSGEEVSTREVKKILQDLIENEDKKKPLTDDKIAKILKEKGYNIARRTVAKYREQLGIPVARLRKEI